jgi:AIPR protein
MDRITQSLLDEFSREHGVESLAEDKRFEHFACYLTLQRHYAETFATSEVVTGAGGDTGIDGIGIIANGSLVTDVEMVTDLADRNGYLDVSFTFVQAERSSSFETSKIGQFSYGVVDFFKDVPTLPRNAAIKQGAEIMAAVYERSPKFKRGNPVCRLYYVTTGKWLGDAQLEARKAAAIADIQALNLFRDVEFSPVGADQIQRLYNQAKNAVSREFTFSERTVIPEIPGVSEAYLGLIPVPELISILKDENGEITKSLFYDNVRDFQDYNPVNTEIRQTLESDVQKTRFALMNNGVTIIARTLRATGNRFYVEDFQIVNGCQTSHVLFDQRDSLDPTIMVPFRLIATQDESVTASIIKATNRQTEVKEEHLLALSDFGKKLEQFFQTFPNGKRLFYERRSRQFNSVSGIEKTRIVTPANLIRAYAAMFLEEPHRTTRNYAALLDRVGKDIFGPDHRLESYYVAAFALYRLEYFFRSQTLDAKYKPARYHILLAFRLLVSPLPLPRPNSHEMERYCETIQELLWDVDAADKLFVKASAAVDAVAKGNFDRDFIRTQPFTESLKAECKPAMPTKK